MQDKKEIERINRFIWLISPIVAGAIKNLLQIAGLKVSQQGCGLDTTFSIEKDGRKTEMYLHNLLLEIATINRDERPLRFDERLRDFDYFLAKMVRVTESKLYVLFEIIFQKDIDAAIESISRHAKDYERIRICRFNQKNQTSQEKQCQ